jgi:hypothetical protein
VISQTSSIVDSSAAALNIVFDLEEFISSLETIICDKDDIEKRISIDQVRTDLMSKRIMLSSFNESETIMRRIVNYSSQEIKMNVKNSKYKIYREASLKKKNIIYRLK